jgi:hypothetical protein
VRLPKALLAAILTATLAAFALKGAAIVAAQQPFPRVQAIPMQDDAVSFRVDGEQVLRYSAGHGMFRPHLFPVIGPAGRQVTRMGHPHDPTGHRHHYSIWVAHHDINAVDFWSDRETAGKQVHQHILAIEDGPGLVRQADGSGSPRPAGVRGGADSAAIRVQILWVAPEGKALLSEERTYRLTELGNGERLIDIHLALTPVDGPVTFGATSFGFAAVRVAKTMTVNDGGGKIEHSGGAVGEDAVFWKPADWCDYSGQAAPDEINGVALMSHPSNEGHPCDWHVRSDGWMGACFSRESEFVLAAEKTLTLRYALYVHRGDAHDANVADRYTAFAASEFKPCEK